MLIIKFFKRANTGRGGHHYNQDRQFTTRWTIFCLKVWWVGARLLFPALLYLMSEKTWIFLWYFEEYYIVYYEIIVTMISIYIKPKCVFQTQILVINAYNYYKIKIILRPATWKTTRRFHVIRSRVFIYFALK